MTAWTFSPDQPLLDARFPMPLDRPFTLAAARERDLGQHQIRALERHGLLRRVLRGVYVAAQAPDDRLLRARAVKLVVPHAAVVTDWSACWLWTGIDAPGDHLMTPPLTVFHRNAHARLRNAVVASGSRRLRPSDVVRTSGIAVTTPLRTAWDLGRLVHRDRAIGGMDALARYDGFSADDVLRGVSAFKGQRGVVQLRELAPLVDARAESPGESLLRLRWHDDPTLPRPRAQVPVMLGGRVVYRIDLGVEALRYGCEYDGEDFHQDTQADLERREDLRRRFGWTVDAVTKTNVSGPGRDVESVLSRGIEQARRRLGSLRQVS